MIIMRKRNVKIKQIVKKANVQGSIAHIRRSMPHIQRWVADNWRWVAGDWPSVAGDWSSVADIWDPGYLSSSSEHTWIYVKIAIAIVNQATSQVISQNLQHTAITTYQHHHFRIA